MAKNAIASFDFLRMSEITAMYVSLMAWEFFSPAAHILDNLLLCNAKAASNDKALACRCN